jgi:putative peptide zinc metalloprotease protein
MVLKLSKPQEVYAEVEGKLVQLNVKNGDWVTKDTVLAKLLNLEKQKELIQRQTDHDISLHKAQWFGSSPEIENRAQAMQHTEYAEQLEPMIQKITDQLGKLTLISSRDGQVVGVPHRETIGQWVKPGKPLTQNGSSAFCEVGDPYRLEAHMILDQSDIHLIGVDSTAWIKIYGLAERTIKSRVSEVAKRSRDEVPLELSNLAQGEVAAKPDPKTGTAKPLTAVYEVIIPVDNPELVYEQGLRGYAKIDGGYHTLAWWLLRWWNKLFNFQL